MAEVYGNRGTVRYHLGDRLGAIADLEKAAKIFSDHGNVPAYQQALTFLQTIQNSPTAKSQMH